MPVPVPVGRSTPIQRENCIKANSNECDRPAKTDFRLGKHEKFDRSQFRHAGNRIEVSRHSTAKLNKRKTNQYKDSIQPEVVDDDIKMCQGILGQAESSPAPKGSRRNSESMGQVQLQNSNKKKVSKRSQ